MRCKLGEESPADSSVGFGFYCTFSWRTEQENGIHSGSRGRAPTVGQPGLQVLIREPVLKEALDSSGPLIMCLLSTVKSPRVRWFRAASAYMAGLHSI